MTLASSTDRRRPRPGRRLHAVVWVLAVAAAAPAVVLAHAVVFPKSSGPGAHERYLLRVPNEKAVATTRVELRVPAGVRVTSFADVPGWQLEVVTDSAKAIAAAIWTGTLPPQRFVEFPFVAVNPKSDTTLAWPAYQTYADGQRVEWTGPEGSKSPASTTVLRATTAAAAVAPPPAGTSWLGGAALALSLLSLGLVLRRSSNGATAS